MNHTPGPWIRADSTCVYTLRNGLNVFSVNVETYKTQGGSDKEAEANASLIAAAPDMYEALYAYVRGDHLTEEEVYAMCSAALAKAEEHAA